MGRQSSPPPANVSPKKGSCFISFLKLWWLWVGTGAGIYYYVTIESRQWYENFLATSCGMGLILLLVVIKIIQWISKADKRFDEEQKHRQRIGELVTPNRQLRGNVGTQVGMQIQDYDFDRDGKPTQVYGAIQIVMNRKDWLDWEVITHYKIIGRPKYSLHNRVTGQSVRIRNEDLTYYGVPIKPTGFAITHTTLWQSDLAQQSYLKSLNPFS